jgi:hypothetical protein
MIPWILLTAADVPGKSLPSAVTLARNTLYTT